MKIKKLGLWSFAKFQALLASFIGLLCGVLYSFGGLIMDSLVSFGVMTWEETPGLGYGTFLAFGALIGMPLIFAVLGFVLGIGMAILYNIFAKLFGGIPLDFK